MDGGVSTVAKLLTAAEIANLAGCHVTYVQRARRLGEIAAIKTTYTRDKKNSRHTIYWYSVDVVRMLNHARELAYENRKGTRSRGTDNVKMCSELHLKTMKSIPFPKPCVIHDMQNSCELCKLRRSE